jgi:hypothetical protein
MSSTAVSLTRLDSDISVAYLALRAARSSRDRSPNAENEQLVAAAERSLDRLLDARLAAQS